MTHESHTSRPVPARPGQELIGVAPLAAIGLFAVNNFWLKATFGNFVTGKLSDLCACFFLPLVISTAVGIARPGARFASRFVVGAVACLLVFVAVKTNSHASLALDRVLTALHPGSLRSHNTVDPSDLVALPMIGIAFLETRRRLRFYETP